jgi:hypothetical protein
VSVYLYCGASEEVQLLQFFLKRFLTSKDRFRIWIRSDCKFVNVMHDDNGTRSSY